MPPTTTFWKKLFLFSLGLSIGAAFCMKWIENDFYLNGQKFSMLGLELFYSKERVATILSGVDVAAKTALRNQLYFDFAFMAGVYPMIASLCMMGQRKSTSDRVKRILVLFAMLQIVAWCCDIRENIFLLNWTTLGNVDARFGIYHAIVYSKWFIAIMGILISLPMVLKKRLG